MKHKSLFLLAITRVTILIVLATSMTSQGQTTSRFPIDDNCPLNFKGPTAAFDVEHDKDTVGGGSLFCRLGVTATQAIRAISDFKTAVVEPDKLSAHSILTFPLEVVIPHTKATSKQRKIPKLMVRTRKEWADFVRYKLNQRQRAAIESAKLSDMLVVNSRAAGPGFILGDGLVFFSTRNETQITVWHLNFEVLGD
jgi:hypothetical protein